MFREIGKLPIGVFYDRQLRCGFKLRPLTVKDSMAARKSEDYKRCEGDDELTGLLVFAHRLEIEGIPREAMNLDLMLEMYDDDLDEIVAADGRLKEQIARFRGQGEKTDHAGPGRDRDALEDGREDDTGAGPGMDRGLAGSEATRDQDQVKDVRRPAQE